MSAADGMVPDIARNARRRVLFVSSNGAGVGHLMRLMAMARRSGDHVEPLFLTMSQAVPVVADNGFFVEYLMSRGYSGMDARPWHMLLRSRLGEIIRTHGVNAIVFDGTWPYRGLLEAFDDHPDVAAIWSRRAMWKPDLDSPSPAASPRFDLIIEPGEFAEAIDRGQTAARRAETTRVAPITFLDRDELLSREDAKRELGLDQDRAAALVQLGAGNINDTSSLVAAVVSRLSRQPDLQVCVTKSIIAEGVATEHRATSLEGIYPLARYLHAFDLAVAASGYNTFHELLLAAVPTLFIPNLETQADDQAARATYGAAAGVCLASSPNDVPGTLAALHDLLDPGRQAALADAASWRVPGNGAADAMAAIEQALGVGDGPRHGGPTGDIGPMPYSLRVLASPPDEHGAGPTAEPVDPAPAAPAATPATTPASSADTGSGSPVDRVAARLIDTKGTVGQLLRRIFWLLPAAVRRPIRRRFVVAPMKAAPRKDGADRQRALRLPVPHPDAADDTAQRVGVAVFLSDRLGQDERDAALARIAQTRSESEDLALLVVTLDDDLTPYRALELPVERLLTRDIWSCLESEDTWSDQLRARIRHLHRTWRLDRVVALGPVGDVDELEMVSLTAKVR